MIKLSDEYRWPLSGKLRKYSDLGMYPLYYLCEDGGILCPDCANGHNGSDAQTQDDPRWNVIACVINWEDFVSYCDHCYTRIESAYGE